MAKARKSVKDKRHKKHKKNVTLASRANERPECSDATCFLSLSGLIDSLKSADPYPQQNQSRSPSAIHYLQTLQIEAEKRERQTFRSQRKILGNSAMSQRYPIPPQYPSILLMASHLSMMAVVQKLVEELVEGKKQRHYGAVDVTKGR